MYAAAAGTVSAVHQWNGTVTCGDTNSYGNMVKLAHGEGLETLYAHLDRLAVVQGQPVSAGEVIGYSGDTGHSFGPHLHFEVRKKASGKTRSAGWTPILPARTLGSTPTARARAGRRPHGRRYRGKRCAAPAQRTPGAKFSARPARTRRPEAWS